MWELVKTVVFGMFAKAQTSLSVEGFNTAISAFHDSQARRTFSRAIRDIIEDEVEKALESKGSQRAERMRYINQNKKRIKEEIRARFDAILQARK